jgi:hypothetical protein
MGLKKIVLNLVNADWKRIVIVISIIFVGSLCWMYKFYKTNPILDWLTFGMLWALVVVIVPSLYSLIYGRKDRLEDKLEKEKATTKQRSLHYSQVFVEKDLMFKKDTVINFCSGDSLELCVNEPLLKPHEDYSKTVNKLLEQEYFSEVWEHRVKRDNCIEAHNALANIFLVDVVGDIQKEFQKNSFDDWNSISLFDICEAIKSNYNQKMFDFNKLDMKQNRIQIFRNIILDYVSSSNFPYNKQNELPYRLLNKSPFNKLFEYKTEAEKHNTDYINGINELIKSVTLSEIAFKGEYALTENN